MAVDTSLELELEDNDVVLILSSTEAEDTQWDLYHLKNGEPWREKYPQGSLSSTEQLLRKLDGLYQGKGKKE